MKERMRRLWPQKREQCAHKRADPEDHGHKKSMAFAAMPL